MASLAALAENDQALRPPTALLDRLPDLPGVGADAHIHVSPRTPYRDSPGEVLGGFGISHDITERKRVDETLRASEERSRAVQGNSLDRFTILKLFFDEQGRIADFTCLIRMPRRPEPQDTASKN